MQSRSAAVAMLAVALVLVGRPVSATATGGMSGDTPVQKVTQLMESMLVKGKEEKRAEGIQFAAYKQFCDDTQTEKGRAIKEAGEQITTLEADIQEYGATVSRLAKEMFNHEEDISKWTGNKKEATESREREQAEYEALHKDYSESIDAINSAITTLKNAKTQVPPAGGSFAQLASLQDLPLIPDDTKQAITTFMQQGEADLGVAAPPNAGEFHSNSVIEMLEKMADEFVDKRNNIDKKEMNAKHTYKMLVKDLDLQIAQAKKEIGEKTTSKASAKQSLASATGDLKDTKTAKAADEKYVADLAATCKKKASDFDARQQLRDEELEAINKAIEIVASGAVKGNADKHLPSLSQLSGSSLLYLRSAASLAARNRLAELLRRRSEALDSRALGALAERVALGSDPLKKVKKMIQDLITKMVEQANADAEQGSWCDSELATNKNTRKSKSEVVETLQSEIDELEASSTKLAEEMTELAESIANLDKAIGKATDLRKAEKAKNEKTIADSQEAQEAVEQALMVLKDFFEKAGEAESFAQTSGGAEPAAPEVFDKPYKGMQGEGGGVVGMLEVIESDFEQLQSDTTAAEETADKEFDNFLADSKSDKDAKTKDLDHKTFKKQDKTQLLVTKKEDLEATQKELTAALEYYDKLKPKCIDLGMSHKDKVAQRQEEIKALQDAMKSLSSE